MRRHLRANTANGTKIQLWTCNGTGAQVWTYTAARDLVNPQANKCLDATGPSSADGTPLQIWSCTGGANQKWTAPAAGGGGSSAARWSGAQALERRQGRGRPRV
jgi:Ricin-type beta-trefoil lectin domain